MRDNTVLFVLISEYADWEPAFLTAGLQWGYGLWNNPYAVKTVSCNKLPVSSIGGFTVMPDYSFEDMPENFAALILIGGTGWHGPEAEKALPLVQRALAQHAVIGAICDASIFLATHGFLMPCLIHSLIFPCCQTTPKELTLVRHFLKSINRCAEAAS